MTREVCCCSGWLGEKCNRTAARVQLPGFAVLRGEDGAHGVFGEAWTGENDGFEGLIRYQTEYRLIYIGKEVVHGLNG